MTDQKQGHDIMIEFDPMMGEDGDTQVVEMPVIGLTPCIYMHPGEGEAGQWEVIVQHPHMDLEGVRVMLAKVALALDVYLETGSTDQRPDAEVIPLNTDTKPNTSETEKN